MRTKLLVLLAAGLLPAAAAAGGDAGKRELEKIQGTWVFQSLEEGDKKTPEADLKNRRIFFGANQFLVKHGDELVQLGTLKLDPVDGRRDVDAMVLAGPHKGKTMLGIYRIKGDTLTFCFDPEGNDRPTDFKVDKDSGYVLAVYKRLIPPGEEIKITGKYKSESIQINGEKQAAEVEIRRLGDSYHIKWSKGILDAYVGIGIRKGNVLSVSWLSQGQAGVSFYQIEEGPRLVGEWTMLGGPGVLLRETMTATGKRK